MTWKDINVFQWQQITDLFTKESKDLTDLDLAYKATAIVMDLTENQIDSLPIDQLKPLLEQVQFLHEEIKPVAAKFIQVNDRRYRCIYDIRKMPSARYIESKYFDQDRSGNLHKLAACMVMPQKRNWMGRWVDDKFDASKHSQYAEDMLAAPITSVLGSVVFFCQVYINWIKSSKAYLTDQMMTQGMSKYQAEKAYIRLCKVMDGFIKPNWLLNTKPSGWRKFMHYLLSNS
jgi:hypothetical protein